MNENKPTYIQALISLLGDKVLHGHAHGPIDKIHFKDGTTLPTEEKIQTELKKLTDEYDSKAYARNRAAEYPSNGDQWDMIYKDNKNSTTTHADAVEAVKTKWPKDNSGPVE